MSSTTKLTGVVARGGDVPQIDPTQAVIIGLDRPDSDQYWWAFCPRADEPAEDEMVAAFRASNDVTDPIKVRRDGNDVVLLDGRRRVKAARVVWNEQKKAGVPERDRICVRFIVAAGTDEDAARVNREGNEGRKDYTPSQKAQQLAHFAKFLRGGQAEIGAKMGISAGTVRNLTAILECAPIVQRAIDDGVIAYSHAPTFAKLDRAEQAKRLNKMVEAGATKGQRAAKAVKTGRTEPTARMRSRLFLEKWKEALDTSQSKAQSAVGFLLAFILGDDKAMNKLVELDSTFKSVVDAAISAKLKPVQVKPPKLRAVK